MLARLVSTSSKRDPRAGRFWSSTGKQACGTLLSGSILWDRISNIRTVDLSAIEVLRAEPGLLMPGRSLERVVVAALARGNLGTGTRAETKAASLIKQNRQFTEVDERTLPDGRRISVISFPSIDGGFLTQYSELPSNRDLASQSRRDTDRCLLQEIINAAGYGNLAQQLSLELLERHGSLGRILSAVRQKRAIDEIPTQAMCLLDLISRTMLHTLRSDLEGKTIINNEAALHDYLRARLADEPNEISLALYFNAANHLLDDEVIAVGGVLNCPTDPKKVCKRALELGATAVIIVHNHPSGDPKPSQSDYVETKRFEAALKVLDLRLHDSLIVGQMAVFSSRRAGYLTDS